MLNEAKQLNQVEIEEPGSNDDQHKKIKGPNVFQKLKRNVHIPNLSYVLMAPYFILFFVFTIFPVLLSVILSFTYFNVLVSPRWVGWENYARLFLEDDVFLI